MHILSYSELNALLERAAIELASVFSILERSFFPINVMWQSIQNRRDGPRSWGDKQRIRFVCMEVLHRIIMDHRVSMRVGGAGKTPLMLSFKVSAGWEPDETLFPDTCKFGACFVDIQGTLRLVSCQDTFHFIPWGQLHTVSHIVISLVFVSIILNEYN